MISLIAFPATSLFFLLVIALSQKLIMDVVLTKNLRIKHTRAVVFLNSLMIMLHCITSGTV
jgi:hypothetical protein